MKATIKDIAKETGLSISTISMVLNDKGSRFSEKTRKLVLDTARRLDYRPNPLAVGLLTRRTRTVGFIIPEIRNHFFADIAKGAEDKVRSAGYSLLLVNTDDDFDLECQGFRTMMDRAVDGIIIIMSTESAWQKSPDFIKMVSEARLPVVLVDQFNGTEPFSSVSIDNDCASSKATRHLLELGHRRIACIAAPVGPKTNEDRVNGFVRTLAEAGVELEDGMLVRGNFNYEDGYAAIPQLMKKNPTAIFCHNDLMAYGAIRALKDSGLRVPQDVSVMGFDDIFYSRYMDVPLTTITQPAYILGSTSADLLLGEIDDPARPKQHIAFEVDLVVRESTMPPACG